MPAASGYIIADAVAVDVGQRFFLRHVLAVLADNHHQLSLIVHFRLGGSTLGHDDVVKRSRDRRRRLHEDGRISGNGQLGLLVITLLPKLHSSVLLIVQTNGVNRGGLNGRQDLHRQVHTITQLALAEDIALDNPNFTLFCHEHHSAWTFGATSPSGWP